jgi:dolichol-phosphate mannosyltransferase
MSGDGESFVVVATYNERENIEALLARLRDAVPNARVVVVDDNSPDGTGELLEGLTKQAPLLHVLHREGKLGYASAHVAGMQYALEHGADSIVTMDADLSHDPAHLPSMLAQLGDSDIVIGSRYCPGGGTEGTPWRRRLLSKGANVLSRVLLGIPAADCSGGFRVYRAHLLRRVGLDCCTARGYAFLEEVLFRCHRHGARLAEVPIVYVDRRHGASKLSSGIALEALATLFRLFWERIAGRGRPDRHT